MNIALSAVRLEQDGRHVELSFSSATLYVIIEFMERGWFVEIQGLDNPGFAEALFATSNIEMRMFAVTLDGLQLEGQCFVHPQMDAGGVNLKGEGPLIGYEQIERRTMNSE